MSFIEKEATEKIEMIGGQKVKILTPKTEVTLTNTITGEEYSSNEEAEADIANPASDTQREHIRRDVKIIVEGINLGSDSKL